MAKNVPAPLVCITGLILACAVGGCYSIQNGWLDPTTLGQFTESATMDIRTSLTLEDTPPGIPGAEYPAREDLEIVIVDHPISAGDTIAIEINELRDRYVPYAAQVQVSSTGYVNLPILGRIKAVELTVPEFEEAVRAALIGNGILVDPQVTANPIFLQKATYSVFGIGVSASNTAPLRAGTFPMRRPDLRVLEAINQVGGLNEFVSDVYVFRYDQPLDAAADSMVPDARLQRLVDSRPNATPGEAGEADKAGDQKPAENPEEDGDDHTRRELLDAVVPPARTEQPERGVERRGSLEDELEPDRAAPYLFIDGEFVPNPTYRGKAPATPEASALPPIAPFESATPLASWSRIAGDSTYRIIRINADRLRNGNPESNIFVRAGDVIRIVSGEIGVYYVMGQVNRVGPFAFNAEPITLKSAIAAAGGLSSLAWPDRCTVYRRLGQREQMIQVNLDEIFAGKGPDFLIRRGDIINVGTHPFAPYLQRIRQLSLPDPTTTVGYGFTYTRNFADVDSFGVRQNPNNQPDRFPNLFP